VRRLRLVIFSSRKSSVFRHASVSRLRDVYCLKATLKHSEDLVEKWYLPLYMYLTQTVHSNGKTLSPWRKNCLSKFLWCAAHIIFNFNFLQGKVVSFFRLCLLHEDGIVEVSMPGFIWQKKPVNFRFNSKILSLLINIQSVNFLSSAQLQNVSFS